MSIEETQANTSQESQEVTIEPSADNTTVDDDYGVLDTRGLSTSRYSDNTLSHNIQPKVYNTLEEFIKDLDTGRNIINNKHKNPEKLYEYKSKNAGEIINYINGLDIDDDYKKFLIAIGKRESGLNPLSDNKIGYTGIYQFGDIALKAVGMTRDEYMKDYKNQIEAMMRLVDKNKKALSNIIKWTTGKKYRDKPITMYGLLGAAHLGGAKGTINFINSGFKSNPKDAFGTSIGDYLYQFS